MHVDVDRLHIEINTFGKFNINLLFLIMSLRGPHTSVENIILIVTAILRNN